MGGLLLLLSLLAGFTIGSNTNWRPDPAGFGAACTTSVQRYRAALSGLATNQPPTFASLVLPLEAAQAGLDDATATARILATRGATHALRDAATACALRARAATARTEASPHLYRRLKEVLRSGRFRDASDRALTERWMRLLRAGGAGLAPAGRRELQQRRAELATIEYAYERRPDATLFERAVATRDRIAHLLRYESWSDAALARTTLGSTARAHKLLEAILARTHPATDVAPERTIDAALVAAHFPLATTVSGVLDVFARLFAVSIARNDGASAWSRHVRVYDVTDPATGSLLGTLYLELAAPTAAGRAGAFVLQPARDDGAVFYPPASLASVRIAATTQRAPAVLTHAQLRALFGSVGSALAMLFARTPYERLNRLTPELVSASSAAFSQLAWEPSILARLSAHDPLPSAVVRRLLATRSSIGDRALVRAAELASADLKIDQHGVSAARAAWPALDPHERAQIVRGEGRLAATRALALLYGADLFTAFEGSPLDPAVGLRYRQELLEPARSDSLLAEMRRFLARPPRLQSAFMGSPL